MCGFVFSGTHSVLEDWRKNNQVDILTHRGPDDAELFDDNKVLFGFHRLAIMDTSAKGNQPFHVGDWTLMCNGEIYNFEILREFLKKKGYEFTSDSDCEVLLPLFLEVGVDAGMRMLDAEFACVFANSETGEIFAGRDPFGIRPMFYGFENETGAICFASEGKGLINFCRDVQPFPIGSYYKNGEFVRYNDVGNVSMMVEAEDEELAATIREKLETAVIKRLHADAPLGFLLSGGLDSSLVCAIAAKHLDKPIRTFAVGMDYDPIDLKYARDVAEYLGTEHTEVIMTKDDVLEALRTVIYHLETYDITTIRASMGMYIIAKYIHENTDLKVLLTGEVSDEMFGYKYTDYAPDAASFQEEARKRVRELYMYDVLRADRTLAANSLEARVPFADLDFARFVMSINPSRKMNVHNQGKYLLRLAFKDSGLLPESILYREKAAFSDAVGHSMVEDLQQFADDLYSDSEYAEKIMQYDFARPFTKESLLYREIFEEFYPGYATWVKDFWMPNKEWVGSEVNDPSARVLPNYGKSGE
jgi:asparagine synthase (glutamine-hydrolysing)